MDKTRTVGILIFDEVEVLDFCGPFEVFSVAGRREGREPFDVKTVAERQIPIRARGGLSTNPNRSLPSQPGFDILLIPGGYGTRRLLDNDRVIAWIKQAAENAELVLSVCTGALLLARTGLLDGLRATTHHGALDLLRELAPNTDIEPEQRFIDNGKFILAAGISAGIDMSLYVVSRLLGAEHAAETAAYMEYDWAPEKLNATIEPER